MDDITRPSPPTTSAPPVAPPSAPVEPAVSQSAPVSIPVNVATAPTIPDVAPVAPMPAPVASPAPVTPATPAITPTPIVSQPMQSPRPPENSDGFTPAMDPSLETAVPAGSIEVTKDTPASVEETPGKVSAAPATSAPKRKGGRAAIIILAVLIALGLIAGAGYAYWSNNKTVAPKPAAQVTNDEPAKITPAKASDVDSASKAIDASLNKVDDTNDYQANELSDATLGL